MHEMSIVKRFMNIAINTAQENNITKVKSVVLQVGEMTDLVPHYLQKYYQICAEGTLLEGSELEIEMVPFKVLCNDCGETYFPMHTENRLCPKCHSGNCHILEGRDVTVKEIKIEEEA